MEIENIILEDIKLTAFYIYNKSVDDPFPDSIDIYAVHLDGNDITALCEKYKMMPDIYSRVWDKIS